MDFICILDIILILLLLWKEYDVATMTEFMGIKYLITETPQLP